MSVVKKSDTTKKLEKLAEKVPPPISWFVPDPYDPTSYIHPVAGMTTMKGLKHLLEPYVKLSKSKHPIIHDLWYAPRQEFTRMFKLWLHHPKELREQLKNIRWTLTLPPGLSGRYVYSHPTIPTPYIELGEPRRLRKDQLGRKPYMTFSHELNHQVFDNLMAELSQKLQRPLKPREAYSLSAEVLTEWLSWVRAGQSGVPYRADTSLYSLLVPHSLEKIDTSTLTKTNVYEPVIDFITNNINFFFEPK